MHQTYTWSNKLGNRAPNITASNDSPFSRVTTFSLRSVKPSKMVDEARQSLKETSVFIVERTY